MRLLLVEDDSMIGESLVRGLRDDAYTVDWVRDGATALRALQDAQAGYAATVFHSWLLVVRGTLRRTGPRGISLNASGAWELSALRAAWEAGGLAAVEVAMRAGARLTEAAVHGAAESRSTRPVMTDPPVGGTARVYSSGFAKSPYADIGPAGTHPGGAPRKLWHSSPGSSGA